MLQSSFSYMKQGRRCQRHRGSRASSQIPHYHCQFWRNSLWLPCINSKMSSAVAAQSSLKGKKCICTKPQLQLSFESRIMGARKSELLPTQYLCLWVIITSRLLLLISGFGSSQPLMHVHELSLMLKTMWSKESLGIISSPHGVVLVVFFFLPIFCSFPKSWLWIKPRQITGVLWHVTGEIWTAQKYLCPLECPLPDIYSLEHKHCSYTSGLTSTCPPCSPALPQQCSRERSFFLPFLCIPWFAKGPCCQHRCFVHTSTFCCRYFHFSG